MILESMSPEIDSKSSSNLIRKHLNNSLKLENDTRTSKWKDTVTLRKLKFVGGPTKWQPFIDSFNAAIKFIYLRCFSNSEASHAIAGLSLTNENNKEALDLLKNMYRSPQLIASAHMSDLVQLPKVESGDFHGLQMFYEYAESNMRSLRNLGIDSKSYGSLLSSMIIEKLPKDKKLIISRKIEMDI